MPIPRCETGSFRHNSTPLARAGVVALLALTALGMRPHKEQETTSGKSVPPLTGSPWVPISEDVLKRLADEGKKVGYPGGTAGVNVDPATGDVNMIVPDQGVWRRSSQEPTFTRIDGGAIGGRCETGYALNADPAGRRTAFFMLDGQSGLTLDNGKTWSGFEQHGRGWDFGVVDWSRKSPQDILAIHHESGQELYRSADGGKSWKRLGKDFTAVGLFDSNAYVASKGDGILRSVDGGATWTKVADITPTGRALCVFKGVGYWIAPEGLLVSRDRGATWHTQGSPIDAAWGPFFGRNEKEIAVVGRRSREIGFWRTADAGTTWQLVAPFPEFGANLHPNWTPSKQWAAGWFYNFGWDWRNKAFYASHMGQPTLRSTGK